MSDEPSRGGKGEMSGCATVLILAAVLLLLYLQNSETPQVGAAAGGGGAGPTAPATPDAATRAFMSVPVGSCLRNYYGGFAWGEQLPRRTECDRVDAFYTVTAAGPAAACPTGRSRVAWARYSAYHGADYALCLARRYHAEQCFAGQPRGSGEEQAVYARLDTVWPCDTDAVPEEGDQILRITGYYRSPPDPADRRCTNDPNDAASYYQWGVDGGDSYICAVITD